MRDKEVHSVPVDINPKVNLILAYYYIAVQYVSYYTTRILPSYYLNLNDKKKLIF